MGHTGMSLRAHIGTLPHAHGAGALANLHLCKWSTHSFCWSQQCNASSTPTPTATRPFTAPPLPPSLSPLPAPSPGGHAGA